MDIRKLQRAIVDGLEDVKAQDIVVFNTEHLSPLFERVIIASGTSNRQTKALAASVRDAVRAAGFQILRTEGEGNGEWIIVDCAAAVVHVMQPAIRHYYQLEEIWGEKPVAIKLKSANTRLVKASEPDEEEAPVKAKKASGKATAAQKAATTAPERRQAAKKAIAAKKAAPKAPKVVAKKVVPHVAGKTADSYKVAERKAVAKKAIAVKSAAVKTVAGKKVAAKKAPARKAVEPKLTKIVVNAPVRKKAPAAKPAAAKKIVGRKVAAKVATKKAPARKTAR
jgi:ribosome-associated protein